jgi:hypothetical protein
MNKRTIYNNMQLFKNIKSIACLNKVKGTKINNCSKHSISNFPPFNNVAKRQLSTFSNFPPPEDPNYLMFMAIALTVSYFIVKKL